MTRSEQSFDNRSSSGADDSRRDQRARASRTFAVADVPVADVPVADVPVADVPVATKLLPVVPYHQAATEFLGGIVESCSKYHGELVADILCHPLIEAVHHAFADHRPLCLSPDINWLTLTQGLANHINVNAEELRHHFVRHKGKLEIVVFRDDFIKGSPENPWPNVFQEFSEVIQSSRAGSRLPIGC